MARHTKIARPFDRELETIQVYRQDYKGHEIVSHLSGYGGLSVIVYAEPLSELVWRGDNILAARAWIDQKTIDQVFTD